MKNDLVVEFDSAPFLLEKGLVVFSNTGKFKVVKIYKNNLFKKILRFFGIKCRISGVKLEKI